MRFTPDDVKLMQSRMAAQGQTVTVDQAAHLVKLGACIAPRGTRAPSKMNKTEAAYGQVLELRKRGGEIAWYCYEGITLKLAPDCRVTIDFDVMLADGSIELHEVKGFMRGDASVKYRIATELFPFPILIVRRQKGVWIIEPVRKTK